VTTLASNHQAVPPAPAPAPETIKQLAARLGVVPRTVWRWIRGGVVAGGRTVKLNARRVGARWAISREAWEAFERACNPGAAPVPESPAQMARRMAADQAELGRLLGRDVDPPKKPAGKKPK
jgi:hypothetical protein